MDGFRTKTGRCELADGEVRLEPDLRTALRGYDTGAILVGAVALVAIAALGVVTGTPIRTIVFGLVAGVVLMFLGLAVNVRRERSRIGRIPFEQIEYVKVREGRLGFMSPRFVISRDADDGAAVRYVMMHSIRFAGGREQFERGKELFRDAGLELTGTLPEAEADADDPDEEPATGEEPTEDDADDEAPELDDVVDELPEEPAAGIDYDRYQRTRGEDVDDEPPEEFTREKGDR
jgi:hypothetical protein